MIRNGERIVLRDYAHCTETNCKCKCSTESFGLTSLQTGSSAITLKLHTGYYHDCYKDLLKVTQTTFIFAICFLPLLVLLKCCKLRQGFPPDLIIAPNAGVAAYRSWLQTIVSLLKQILNFQTIWCLIVDAITRIDMSFIWRFLRLGFSQQCMRPLQKASQVSYC